MKVKNFYLKNASRLLTIAICVCVVGLLASCGGDDPEPAPTITNGIEMSVKVNDLTVTDAAGSLNYAEKVTITNVISTTTGTKTETKEKKEDKTWDVKAAWSSTPITISAITGDIKKPTVTYSNNALSFDFGAFKLTDAVKFTNPTYTFTEGGKSATLTGYGFVGGEASWEPVVVVTTVTEGGKNYSVTTISQAFKVKHSQGELSKEVLLSAAYKVETTAVNRGKLTGAEVIDWKSDYKAEDNGYLNTYNIKAKYQYLSVDTAVRHYQYLDLTIYAGEQTAIKVFSDKSMIEPSFLIKESVGRETVAYWKYSYSQAAYYGVSIPQVQSDVIFEVSTSTCLIRWGILNDQKFVLPFLKPVITYKSVEYGTASDQTIDGVLYTVTPANILFEYTLGNNIKKSASIKIEICKKK